MGIGDAQWIALTYNGGGALIGVSIALKTPPPPCRAVLKGRRMVSVTEAAAAVREKPLLNLGECLHCNNA